MDIIINKKHKSIPIGVKATLPEFCIITGKNGSGKSHFLEAMATPELSQVTVNSQVARKIKYIPFNGLNPTIDPICDFSTLIGHVRNIWDHVFNHQNSAKSDINANPMHASQYDNNWLVNSSHDPVQKRTISLLLKKVNRSFLEITEDDVRRHIDYKSMYPEEMFTSQFATVFKSYHTRLEDNRYARYKNSEFGEQNIVLTEEDFIKEYGPPPWILINNILNNASLPYRVNDPLKQNKESTFNLVLFNPASGIEVSLNDLSTGEKVLMSLALAVYNSTEGGTKLDVLLLDEPDAALHPEFSRLLLNTLSKYIVEAAGVNVVITTHSPTTVACARGIPIFEMDKVTHTPVLSSPLVAIRTLTADLPGLRVSADLRRQVFVESKYDVGYFEKIFEFLTHRTEITTSPHFLAPHGRTGANCSDVSSIVNELIKLGNDLVFGIIDYDGSNKSSGRVIVCGQGQRYSIENYIFDPIFVGLLLIRESLISPTSIGLPSNTYISTQNYSTTDWQLLIDYVCKSLGFEETMEKNYTTVGGSVFRVPQSYFSEQGHTLEQLILKTWPEFNAIKRGKSADNILKDHMLDTVVSDFREHLSVDLLETLAQIN